MSNSNIVKFNNYLSLFVSNIIDTFPELKEVLESYYQALFSNNTCDDDKYVKRFMKKLGAYKEEIAAKDTSMFDEPLCVLKNVDFSTIMNSEECSFNNKEKIWEYIQTLFILGESMTTNAQDFFENSQEIFEQMAKNLKKSDQKPEDFLQNTDIGKMAAEIAEEFNPQELLSGLNVSEDTSPEDLMKNMMSGNNTANFMDLFQKVGQKVQKKMAENGMDQEQLMKDAQSLFSNMASGDSPLSAALNPTQERLRKKLERKNNSN
jgi:hypothetical protein